MQSEPAADPIARLRFEHRQIQRALLAINKVIAQAWHGAAPDHAFFAAAVDFIERFADGRHHAKEESGLFEQVREQGFGHSGPVMCMVSQHEHCRELTRILRHWVDAGPAQRAEQADSMLIAADRYVSLLWNHIATEDEVVFPGIAEALSPESLAKVAESYAALDPLPSEDFRVAADALLRLAAAIGQETTAGQEARVE